MDSEPGSGKASHPPTHCWLEVPDLTSVELDCPAHILLIGSKLAEDQILLAALTQEGHQVSRVAGWDQALEALEQETDFELIISAQNASDPSGLGLAHYLSQPHLISSLPVIVACHDSNLKQVMSLLAQGAVDFLNHPFNLQELAVRVKKSLIQYRTMRLYQRAAHRDPLTGLYNKRVFNELLPGR